MKLKTFLENLITTADFQPSNLIGTKAGVDPKTKKKKLKKKVKSPMKFMPDLQKRKPIPDILENEDL